MFRFLTSFYSASSFSSSRTKWSLVSTLSTFLNQRMMTHSFSSFSSSSTTYTYENAICLLDSLQSNSVTLKKQSDQRKLLPTTLQDTEQYLRRLGYTLDQLNSLNVIHIAGTKGKGSTAAFTESIIRHTCIAEGCSIKTGLYTSPHLIEVRERIRINGTPLSREAFTAYFFQVWNRLQETKDQPPFRLPSYFTFLTCLGFHVFLQEKTDVLVSEVGLGGRYDPTTVVPAPLVTALTPLDLDHCDVLGATLEEIAYQKAGILKPRVPCFCTFAPATRDRVAPVYAAVARSVHAVLVTDIVPVPPHVALGLPGTHQRTNAALALRLAETYLCQRVPTCTRVHGMDTVVWPGRGQWVATPSGGRVWCDGAHTVASVRVCMATFVNAAKCDGVAVVVFSCAVGAAHGGRSARAVMDAVLAGVAWVGTWVVVTRVGGRSLLGAADVAELRDAWERFCRARGRDGGGGFVVVESEEAALAWVRAGEVGLVTGSLYLVGGILRALKVPVV